jgi:hypothetical protein
MSIGKLRFNILLSETEDEFTASLPEIINDYSIFEHLPINTSSTDFISFISSLTDKDDIGYLMDEAVCNEASSTRVILHNRVLYRNSIFKSTTSPFGIGKICQRPKWLSDRINVIEKYFPDGNSLWGA